MSHDADAAGGSASGTKEATKNGIKADFYRKANKEERDTYEQVNGSIAKKRLGKTGIKGHIKTSRVSLGTQCPNGNNKLRKAGTRTCQC